VGKHGVKFQARGAYKVDQQEVATFAEELVRELKEASVEEVMVDLQDEDNGESSTAEDGSDVDDGDVDESMEDEEDHDGIWEYSQAGLKLNSDGELDPKSTLESCHVDRIDVRRI